ncbi:hypothetical protein LTR27_001178 [Elasticomyces elasticus]|nr:hypothetical protein LTR27_001178 [Elasticomyces elasticus]
MEASLAREQAADRHVHQLLKDKSQPLGNILQAFVDYRQLCLTNTFAEFAHAQEHQARLWQAHTDGKRYFHDALSDLRKQGNGKSVESRQFAKLYKGWIKESAQFYKGYIKQLSTTFGGITELQAVAHEVKSDSAGESPPSSLSTEERAVVLASCHQALIYIGDLYRYRASEKLDNDPDFGPAVGYYGLACTLRPSSGLGHHQQAVVALEQRAHLKSIYNLYRAIVVDEPHPLAAKNLKLEFGKVNAAWEKGELVPKMAPNDEDAAKRILVGWFVRMHSMCAKGEVFSSHTELEREVLSQLANVLKKETSMSETTLMRMVMINLAAQYQAGVLFQGMSAIIEETTISELTCATEKQQADAQQSFFYFFRLNIKTYTTLLQLFYESVRSLPTEVADDDDLVTKLTPVMRRILPVLRLYSSWLMCNLHLVDGLNSDDFLGDAISTLWATYARTVDTLADEDVFGVWNLDDFGITYMLEEDVDTLGFKPLQNTQPGVRSQHINADGTLKPRFSDAGVVRVGDDEEMLARAKGLLHDGSYLAHETQLAPIGIVGNRIYYGKALQMAMADAEEARNRPPPPPKVKAKPVPLSYAAAAKSGRTVGGGQVNGAKGPAPTAVTSSRTRQERAVRMVDHLVDEEDGNNPVTPPQQHAAHPAVVTNGELNGNGAPYNGFTNMPSHQPKAANNTPPQAQYPAPVHTPPTLRTPVERLQSVSKLWDNDSSAYPNSSFPSGLPMGTLASPPQFTGRRAHHSRVNSATSVRSRASQNIGDSWSSIESLPPHGQQQAQTNGNGVVDGYSTFAESDAGNSMLFGMGGGIWSTGTNGNGVYRGVSPPGGNNVG